MANTVLYDDGEHKNVLLEDFDSDGLAVQANQHVIVHGGEGIILDPESTLIKILSIAPGIVPITTRQAGKLEKQQEKK